MTIPRRELVDLEVTRYYHCISRCVRRARLCGEGFEHRKQWIEARLELLARNFAVSVAGFAVMDRTIRTGTTSERNDDVRLASCRNLQ